jgi:hypothetical protein
MVDENVTLMQAFHNTRALRDGVDVFATLLELLLLHVLIIVGTISVLPKAEQ